MKNEKRGRGIEIMERGNRISAGCSKGFQGATLTGSRVLI